MVTIFVHHWNPFNAIITCITSLALSKSLDVPSKVSKWNYQVVRKMKGCKQHTRMILVYGLVALILIDAFCYCCVQGRDISRYRGALSLCLRPRFLYTLLLKYEIND